MTIESEKLLPWTAQCEPVPKVSEMKTRHVHGIIVPIDSDSTFNSDHG